MPRMLEINQYHQKMQEVQESFNQYLKDIVGGDITDVQMELSSSPVMCHIAGAGLRTERRTFTYDGYTQSGKKFSLIIED